MRFVDTDKGQQLISVYVLHIFSLGDNYYMKMFVGLERRKRIKDRELVKAIERKKKSHRGRGRGRNRSFVGQGKS